MGGGLQFFWRWLLNLGPPSEENDSTLNSQILMIKCWLNHIYTTKIIDVCECMCLLTPDIINQPDVEGKK